MALRCSLLGHDYGESEVDREREERGSEVVVTVQEYEKCLRCGERNVVSENTEVTSMADGPNDPLPDDSNPEHEPSDEHADATESDPEDDIEFVDAESTNAEPNAVSDHPSSAAETPGDDTVLPTDENGEMVTDDGEILEDEPADGSADRDRDHGEWPDSDDVGPPVEDEETETWPDTDEDELPAEDDAVVLEHDESAAGSSTGNESIATESEIADAAAGVETQADADSGSGIERAEPAPIPGDTADSRSDDVPTEFYCPRCEYVATSDRASLRAGDICPDCRKGYLGERPLQ